ncbi:MAG: hypothetical protein VX326_03555, partial [Pseudomonadota bacterium]|nr:hypothetical protein [Pseudomonadota bacterium]
MVKKAETAKKKPEAKATSKKVTKKAPESAARPRGLGRGLSSLLGDAGVAAATGTASPAGLGAPQAGISGSGEAPQSQLSGLGEIPVEWINVGP